jgi:hypothetical protein
VRSRDTTLGWLLLLLVCVLAVAPSASADSSMSTNWAGYAVRGSAVEFSRVTRFNLATATSTGGHTGTISDPAWTATRIRLEPTGRHLLSLGKRGGSSGGATPSALNRLGSSFRVLFAKVKVVLSQFFDRPRSVFRATALWHSGRVGSS